MLIYEYKLTGTKAQYAAIDEAIRIAQFIRNKALRLWMGAASPPTIFNCSAPS